MKRIRKPPAERRCGMGTYPTPELAEASLSARTRDSGAQEVSTWWCTRHFGWHVAAIVPTRIRRK